MAPHRKNISISADNGDCNPKNNIDHRELSANCTPKRVTAIFATLELRPLFHIMYNEIPISRYSVIQTGEKIQLGGLKDGLFNATYQTDAEEIVNKDPINPAD